jgi:acylphosphatase
MMSETVRRRVVVRGEVQGVFFRDETQSQAESQGVSGWVANRDDGAVEAVFEGSSGAVERMVEFCRGGPDRAEVEDVEVTDESPEGLSGFSVR